MAVPNMIVTLAMNATKYSQGLKNAGRQTQSFGQFATKAFSLAKAAMFGMSVALARLLPNLANMGAESRKADVQLRFMLENMQGMGPATDKAVKGMAEYADKVNQATGIDDEQVKAIQRKLLVFDSLRTSAGELGGVFERTTGAAIDLAAAGFGDMESMASKLGKALEEPGKRLKGLADAGIVFTEAELEKIKALKESGDLLGAQEIILQKVEDRVKGLAEETATPFDKLMGKFSEIGDTIGLALLDPLDDLNDKIATWLASPDAEADIQKIVDAFIALGEGASAVVDFILAIKDGLKWIDDNTPDWVTDWDLPIGTETRPGSGGRSGGLSTAASTSSITNINISGVTDSVGAGREIQRALDAYSRARGRS
jgi:hypothetical protein